MSILNQQLDTPTQAAIRQLTTGIQGTKDAYLRELDYNVELFRSLQNPQEVLDALGAGAHEVTDVYEGLTAALQGFFTTVGDDDGLAKLAAIVAKVPEYTSNQDGSVTLAVPEPEELGE